MKGFVTGASGYIGGSVAAGLLASGRHVVGLVRSSERARRIEPLIGILDDVDLLAAAARAADAVINAANLEHRGAVGASPTLAEAGAACGEGAADHTMGSNSRGRAVRRGRELAWAPHRQALLEDLEPGSYRETV